MRVFVLVKSLDKRKITEISAISEDRTKKFHAEIGDHPHRLLMIKAFEDFERFCAQECGLKDVADEVCIINYTRELSGDLFDFDTFMLGRNWCTLKGFNSAANETKQYISALQKTFYENAEKLLDGIEFYQSHASLKPFIGKRYLDNELGIKILLVGESHYVEEPLPEITRESLLFDWWSKTPPLINDISWYTTRGTISNFMSGKSGAAYALFREPCKIYNQCVLNSKYQKWQDIYNLYDSFAYMNYFQMPALYKRISLWSSLLKFNGETNKSHPLSLEIWNKMEELSNRVFLSVVEILNPDKIIFLSKEAHKAFKEQNLNYDKNKIRVTVHPTCAWWNRKMKEGGISGKERLVNIFNELVAENK